MVRLFFLLPIVMCLGWYMFLRHHQIPLKQGLRGFGYILTFNLVLALVLTGLVFLTSP
jgi:lipopolysaccharide biosynthesis regulator YciM